MHEDISSAAVDRGGTAPEPANGSCDISAPAPTAVDSPTSDTPVPEAPADATGLDQQPYSVDTQEDALGVFKESLTAFIELRGLLRTYRATDALIEMLETTLSAARESRQ